MRGRRILLLTVGAILAIASSLTQFASAIVLGENNPGGVNTATGGNTKVTFKRVIKGVGEEKINNTFNYTITPSSNNPADSTNAPSTASVVFDNVQPAYNQESNSLEAVAFGEIDFHGTVYKHPGDYEYVIKEVSSSNSDYELESKTYTAVVSVRNYDDGSGIIYPSGPDWLQGTVVAGMINNDTGEKEDDPIFGNAISEKGFIDLTAYETGDAADDSICFEYTLYIEPQTSAPSSVSYNINYTKGAETYDFCAGSAETVTPGQPAKIYLRNWYHAYIGQITNGANQIPVGTNYRIEQTVVDGYNVSINTNGSGLNGLATTSSTGTLTVTAGANEVQFVNTKNSAVFTGLILGALPYVIAGAIAGLGIAIVIFVKKR